MAVDDEDLDLELLDELVHHPGWARFERYISRRRDLDLQALLGFDFAATDALPFALYACSQTTKANVLSFILGIRKMVEDAVANTQQEEEGNNGRKR